MLSTCAISDYVSASLCDGRYGGDVMGLHRFSHLLLGFDCR